MTKLQELWDLIKDNAELCYIGGSRVLGFNNESSDTDLIILCKSFEDIRKCMITVRNNKFRKYFDIFYDNISNEIPLRPVSYIYHFLDKSKAEYYGDINSYKPDLLGSFKNKYLMCLKRQWSRYNKSLNKRCYHILAGLYIVSNNKYDFTSEQLNNIKIIHDQSYSEEKKQELIDLIETEFSKYDFLHGYF